MVNNINGGAPTQNGTSRSREKPQAPEQIADTGARAAGKGDQVALSPEAKQLQDIEAGLNRLPEVNQERVAHIRDALRSGDYSVDPARLAAKIVQFELDI